MLFNKTAVFTSPIMLNSLRNETSVHLAVKITPILTSLSPECLGYIVKFGPLIVAKTYRLI